MISPCDDYRAPHSGRSIAGAARSPVLSCDMNNSRRGTGNATCRAVVQGRQAAAGRRAAPGSGAMARLRASTRRAFRRERRDGAAPCGRRARRGGNSRAPPGSAGSSRATGRDVMLTRFFRIVDKDGNKRFPQSQETLAFRRRTPTLRGGRGAANRRWRTDAADRGAAVARRRAGDPRPHPLAGGALPDMTREVFSERDTTVYALYQSRYDITVVRIRESITAAIAARACARCCASPIPRRCCASRAPPTRTATSPSMRACATCARRTTAT